MEMEDPLIDDQDIQQSIKLLSKRLDDIAKREADMSLLAVVPSAAKQKIIENMEDLLTKWEALNAQGFKNLGP